MMQDDASADRPVSTASKLIWISSVIHLFLLNPTFNVSLPLDWKIYANALAVLMMGVSLGFYFFLTWILSREVSKDQVWPKILILVLVLCSLPVRVFNILGRTSALMSGGNLSISFLASVGLVVVDSIMLYVIFSPSRNEEAEVDDLNNAA